MNINLKEKQKLKDGIRYILQVSKSDLVFLGYIYESFEGFCNFTTIDSKNTIVQMDCTHDFEKQVDRILEELQKKEYQSKL